MNSSQSPIQLRALKWLGAAYSMFAIGFIAIYVWRFRSNPISDNPTDWTGFAEMLGALLGPPLALWSVALVLQSIRLQQNQLERQQHQHEETLLRENRRLDPVVNWIERDRGEDRFPQFLVDYSGDAQFMMSQIPGSTPQLATYDGIPRRRAALRFWKAHQTYPDFYAFVCYQRANGSLGWYRISVSERKVLAGRLDFSLMSVDGPAEPSLPSGTET